MMIFFTFWLTGMKPNANDKKLLTTIGINGIKIIPISDKAKIYKSKPLTIKNAILLVAKQVKTIHLCRRVTLRR